MDCELMPEPDEDGTNVTQSSDMLPPENSPLKHMVDAAQVERSIVDAMANLELLQQIMEQ